MTTNADRIEVQTHTHGETTILSPIGEIDLSRSPALRKHIAAAQSARPKRLIVDLAGVPYMDSSGIATLIEAMTTARRHGGKLVLCGLQERVRSIFEIAKLTMVFTIVESRDDGLKA